MHEVRGKRDALWKMVPNTISLIASFSIIAGAEAKHLPQIFAVSIYKKCHVHR